MKMKRLFFIIILVLYQLHLVAAPDGRDYSLKGGSSIGPVDFILLVLFITLIVLIALGSIKEKIGKTKKNKEQN